MVFSRDVIHAGVLPGYRFSPRSDVFATPRSYPENSCFCDGAEKELCDMIGDGMFAISSCQFDAPIVLSWPHFLHANQSYLNSLTGLTPDAEKHSFYFDVQPTTGTTLAAKARIQINLAIKKNKAFKAVSQVQLNNYLRLSLPYDFFLMIIDHSRVKGPSHPLGKPHSIRARVGN